MRILHIVTSLSTGGAEHTLLNMLSHGLASRFHSTVISLRDCEELGEQIKALGVPVYALGIRRGIPGPAALLRLRNLVHALRPDIVQGWMYHGNLAASAARGMVASRPAVAWNVRHCLYCLEDEKLMTQWVIQAGRKISYQPDRIIYNSRVSREQHEAFGFATNRGCVIPNGFDVSTVDLEIGVRARVRQELSIPDDSTVVGHVARFHPMKNHTGFLRAAVAVARKIPKTQFLLAGRDVRSDNPAFAGVVPPELLSRFHFLGERDDVPDLMRAMDWFCLSSRSEAFPNVVGEAMASGLPCVVTDVGDCADLVDETGIIVPRYNFEDLAEGLLQAVTSRSPVSAYLGQMAQERIREKYRVGAVVQRYCALYYDLFQGGIS